MLLQVLILAKYTTIKKTIITFFPIDALPILPISNTLSPVRLGTCRYVVTTVTDGTRHAKTRKRVQSTGSLIGTIRQVKTFAKQIQHVNATGTQINMAAINYTTLFLL